MKTAEQTLRDFTINHPYEATENVVLAMKEYAQQVAKKALEDAAKNIKMDYSSRSAIEKLILDTEIKLP